MQKMLVHRLAALGFVFLISTSTFGQQFEPLSKRIAHFDPAAQPVHNAVHDGAGSMTYADLVSLKYVTGNWGFYQYGILNPHSSIGAHFHLNTEEMFVILDGDAQFTVDGRTSVIKGPAAVPVRLGHSHAVYNPTDRPMQWMDMSVAVKKGSGGAFNLGDQRLDAVLDRVPQFISARLDRTKLLPLAQNPGGVGTVEYRRVFQPSAFLTTWAYVDHFLLDMHSSTGPSKLTDVSEIYFVLAGAGTVTVNDERAPIKKGDAIPVDMGQIKSFAQTGSEPLEMYVVGVARDMDIKNAMSDTRPAPASDGTGR
jgi:mannose-6-phosphate isomerase-like protein (cupin superfamily)